MKLLARSKLHIEAYFAGNRVGLLLLVFVFVLLAELKTKIEFT